MSDDAAEGPKHDALIIKRGGGGHHDEHHGGVWKIAFADFMTAMMAFFLVMWLISANDKTKAVIAKYFNPIELVDSTPQPRGLSDPKKDDPNIEHKTEADAKDDAKQPPGAKEPTQGSEGKHGKENQDAKKAEPAPASAAPHPDAAPLDDADHSPSHAEVELIRDPYAVLAEIADKSAESTRTAAEKATAVEGGKGAIGARGGEAYRDPFQPQPIEAGRDPFAAPVSRSDLPVPDLAAPRDDASRADRPQDAAPAAAAPAAAEAATTPATAPGRSDGPKAGAAIPSAVQGPDSSAAPSPPASGRDAGHQASAVASPPLSANPGSTPPPEAGPKPLAPAALRAEIVAAAKALDPSPTHAGVPGIEVRRTEEGLLVSLTDSADYAMFPSASARPSARSVALVATIGKLLKAQKGSIVVRGYTDSRPFRSDVYDNWRLSSERAHIAQYMLVRGGLDERRIDRIEGLADRHPRNAKDPAAPENRRIEILLRETTP